MRRSATPQVSAPERERTQDARPGGSILQLERNCWRIERAERFRCVQDGAEYFELVHDALLRAQRSVFILGWDIAAGVDLLPGRKDSATPTRLGELLDFIARRNRDLHCYVLVWDYAALYALERDPFSRIKLGWRTHRHVQFRYDDQHPFGASHHQKIVVVDDRLAFSGGLDLTGHRWDLATHPVEHELRKNAIGEPYTPFHDVQALVEGPVAASLGALARERWRRAGARRAVPLEPSSAKLWPSSVEPDIVDVDVAISRTEPRYGGRDEVRECEALFYDSIAAAQRSIYVENQYFSNRRLADALAARLREPDGPEIVVVGPKQCSGWLEEKTMGALRCDVLVALRDADRDGRLRLLQAAASRAADVSTFVHSKVTLIDDELLRIGSANLSNRSMGMDTECDLTIEARGDERIREGIRRVRDRLLAEHVAADVERVREAIERAGSLRVALDELSDGDHALVPIDVDELTRTEAPETIQLAADPSEPMAVTQALDRLLPEAEASDRRARHLVRLLPVLALFAALAIAWRSTDVAAWFDLASLRAFVARAPEHAEHFAIAIACIALAGLLLVPIEALVFLAAVLFGFWRGLGVAVVGVALATVAGYALGRALGPRRLAPLTGSRAYRLWSELRGRGVASVALLRWLSLTSAAVVNLLCGAAKVPARAYAAGTALGSAPWVLAMCVMGWLVRRTMLDPGPWTSVATAAVAFALAALALRMRRKLLMRQYSAAREAQLQRSRFG